MSKKVSSNLAQFSRIVCRVRQILLMSGQDLATGFAAIHNLTCSWTMWKHRRLQPIQIYMKLHKICFRILSKHLSKIFARYCMYANKIMLTCGMILCLCSRFTSNNPFHMWGKYILYKLIAKTKCISPLNHNIGLPQFNSQAAGKLLNIWNCVD